MHVSFFLFFCLHTHQTTLYLPPAGGVGEGQTHQTPTNHNSSPPAGGVGGGLTHQTPTIHNSSPPAAYLVGVCKV